MGYDELEQSEEITLIDFLYKDDPLVKSLYSQLFSGNLEYITKSEIAADEVDRGMDAGIKGILKGDIKTKESSTNSLTKSISPDDYRIIELLSNLNFKFKNLDECETGTLVAIKGSMMFRNFELINNLMPFIIKSGMVPDLNQSINPKSNGKNKNITLGNVVENMLKMLPYGLEFELHNEYNQSIMIILKEEGLTTSSNDLVRAYGREIPGEWVAIGVLDKTSCTSSTSKSTFRVSIDAATDVLNNMVNNGNNFVLKPLVIYRKLAI